MKRFFALLAVLMMVAGVANAQYFGEYHNEIGIFTTTTPTVDNAQEMATYNGALYAPFDVYVVMFNPYNELLDQPITRVGGFEFLLTLPTTAFVTGVTLPPLTTNFATPPTYYCGTNIPVVNGMCTLVTLTMVASAPTPGFISMGPVDPAIASHVGEMSITDYNDGFSISQAHPISGDFAAPVFGLFSDVVPTADASWGELHSLFR
jgi:hypothetical protein